MRLIYEREQSSKPSRGAAKTRDVVNVSRAQVKARRDLFVGSMEVETMIDVNPTMDARPRKAAERTVLRLGAPQQWPERKGKSTSCLCPSDVTPYCMQP